VSGTLKNDLLLRALLREPTPRRPIWLMRQAGRYLPEYRATRARAGNSFLAMCTNPDIACEVTLQPVRSISSGRRHSVLGHPHDSARDETWGWNSRLERGLHSRIRCAPGGYSQTRRAGPGRELRYVIDAVALVRRGIGRQSTAHRFRRQSVDRGDLTWWKGAASKTFGQIKRMMYEAPRDLHRCSKCWPRPPSCT